MSITEFLNARIAEDESQAWSEMGSLSRDAWPAECSARVLAECAAKRAIVKAHTRQLEISSKEFGPAFHFVSNGMAEGLAVAIEILAAVYAKANHPVPDGDGEHRA